MKKDELEKVKNEYGKYIKFIKLIIFVLVIIAIVLILRTIYKFSIIYKVVENNVWMELGDNYKITTYDENTGKVVGTIYYKNGIKKDINNGVEWYTTPDEEMYWIILEQKEYQIIIDELVHTIRHTAKESLFTTSGAQINEKIQKSGAIKSRMKDKISTEIYNNKEYFFVDGGYSRWYIDKDDFLVKYKKFGKDFYRYEIELNSVTDEDVEFPDFSEYTKIDGSE